MKKTRILRALKKRNSIDYKEDSVLSFKDEKGKEYHYLNIITNAVNKVLGQAFDILDNVKIKNKILKGLNNEKK